MNNTLIKCECCGRYIVHEESKLVENVFGKCGLPYARICNGCNNELQTKNLGYFKELHELMCKENEKRNKLKQ